MLSRIYIDNFRAFVKFEHRFKSTQLLLGANGAGKTSLLQVLLTIRQLVARGDSSDSLHFLRSRTVWLSQPKQTFEFDIDLKGSAYVYHLEIEPWGEPVRARIAKEIVTVDGNPLLEFVAGEVRLFNDAFELVVTYPLDSLRSALATISEASDRMKLYALRNWFSSLFCFRLDPFAMSPVAEGEDPAPNVNLSNFAAWYRHLLQSFPQENDAFLKSLKQAMPGFRYMKLAPHLERSRGVLAEFEGPNGNGYLHFYFGELSEGQRCIIGLYAILHFVVAKGGTVIIDEPDNFLALPEIQPWLMSVTDAVETCNAQVILISHHPEFINQWASSCGLQFIRDGAGPVRVKQFYMDPDTCLTPAEVVARGWADGNDA